MPTRPNTDYFHAQPAYKQRMAGRTLLPEEITRALEAGGTVITGNQRAARTLRQEVDLHNRACGLTHWNPPAILAWDAWTATLWQQLLLDGHATKLLLNRPQEHTLWRGIIAADSESTTLRTADSLAEMAAEAFARLGAYRGESRLRTAGVSADTRAFQRWAQTFERRCRSENYLPQAELESSLTAAISSLQLSRSGYLLAGFDGATPAQQILIQAMQRGGIPVNTFSLEVVNISPELVTAPEEDVELQTAAHWIRQCLEADPTARVALIVPNLGDHRASIERVLSHTLAPEVEDITAPQRPVPFEFSLGVPLSQTPIVSTALDLLRWTINPLPHTRISQLLLSPYFASNLVEINARAEFDAYELRRIRTLRPELTLDAMARFAGASRRSRHLPHLVGALGAMRRAITAEALASAELRPASDWADAIRALLEAAGWAAGTDDSIEFQTRQKWESILDELATLDFDGVRLSFPDALDTVARLAQQALFAPESRNAPVQVLGPLESAGSTFDVIWFLHAGDQAWPVHPGSSPLLAWHLQRDLHMPGTDAAEDTALARRITERIARSAPVVFFSYAEESALGHQRPSPALANLTLTAASLPTPESDRTLVSLETLNDSSSLPPLPDQIIRGGATILKLQAACGFRAFAEQRLWASSLDTAEAGMDARERGSTVHAALQSFWNEVRTQTALRSMTSGSRQTTLARAIDAALQKDAADALSGWDTAYLDVQRERLLALLDPWLLSELDRRVPFTVKSQETDLNDVQIGPLRLNLRVDRIDETEFGDVILDYKTGTAKPTDWLTERPDEPQLPLYAVLADSEQLAGVAFAQVRAGKDRGLHGYQIEDGILLKPSRSNMPLDAQVDEWRRILTTLAVDFHDGDLRVRPKRYPFTCEHCNQRILCRLDLSVLDDRNDDDDVARDEDGDDA